ncbi:hypothetical protein KY308_01555 [Candidatus Woesearchaeota archaeon]|nr:hypothetical protein [Candidatus Woesearchaeota archaeon]
MRGRIFFLVSFIFALMILALINSNPSITGSATDVILTAGAEIKQEVDAVMSTLQFDKPVDYLAEGAEICFVVEVNNTRYYYNLVKTHEGADVQNVFCADPDKNNIIIKFNSYEDLLEAKSKPRWFIIEKRNVGYYILPSNYVKQGGEVVCSPDFQQKYCGALYKYLGSSEISAIGLPCCASYRFTPAGMAFAFGASIEENWWIYASVLALILALLYFSMKRKKKH